MLRRWVLTVALGLLSLVAAGALAVRAADPGAARSPITGTGPVVLAGIPQARWDEVSARRTPGTAALLDAAAVGVLLPRAHSEPTCTPDGWLTLSAGRGADAGCRAPALTPTGGPVTVPGWDELAARSRDLNGSPRPGLLASALAARGRCVAAVGPQALLGAADTRGRVARAFPALSAAALSACPVTLVDLSTRGAAPAGGEEQLERLLTDVPAEATLVLAGISDGHLPDAAARRVMVLGPGVRRGVLDTRSTRQPGLVQTADLTALLLARTGTPVPDAVTGQAPTVRPDERPSPALLARMQSTSRALDRSNALALPWLVASGLLAVAVLLAGAATWWRAGRAPRWLPPVAAGVGSLPVGSFLAACVPWWSGGPTTLWFALATLAGTLLVTGLAHAGPWRRWPGGPALAVAAATLTVLVLDVVSGSRLQLVGLQGLLPLQGGRFYGMGNAAFGFLASAALLAGGLAAIRLTWWDDTDRTDRRLAAATVLLLGAGAAVVDAVPVWGADLGGPPALLLGTALLAMLVAGARPTARRLGAVAAGALLLVALVALADRLRPPGSRTHLGSFVQQVQNGRALPVIGDKLTANLRLLLETPFNVLVPVGLALVWWALLRPGSAAGRVLRPAWAQVPQLRHLALALLLTWTVALVLNDSGVVVPATGAQLAVPLLVGVAAAADRRARDRG